MKDNPSDPMLTLKEDGVCRGDQYEERRRADTAHQGLALDVVWDEVATKGYEEHIDHHP